MWRGELYPLAWLQVSMRLSRTVFSSLVYYLKALDSFLSFISFISLTLFIHLFIRIFIHTPNRFYIVFRSNFYHMTERAIPIDQVGVSSLYLMNFGTKLGRDSFFGDKFNKLACLS